jgi:hypothetical protein
MLLRRLRSAASRIEPIGLIRLQPLLATRVFVDLVDVDEQEARARLLAAVGSAGLPADPCADS